MDKYYEPEIEEFHVGFEYELVPSTGLSIIDFSAPKQVLETRYSTEFEKGIYGIKSVNFLGDDISTIKSAIKNNKCRVKYLDEEDILELGFTKRTRNYWYGYDDYIIDINCGKRPHFLFATLHKPIMKTGLSDKDVYCKIILHRYSSEDNFIDDMIDEGDSVQVFFGELKNISELRKVLKMLHVTC